MVRTLTKFYLWFFIVYCRHRYFIFVLLFSGLNHFIFVLLRLLVFVQLDWGCELPSLQDVWGWRPISLSFILLLLDLGGEHLFVLKVFKLVGVHVPSGSWSDGSVKVEVRKFTLVIDVLLVFDDLSSETVLRHDHAFSRVDICCEFFFWGDVKHLALAFLHVRELFVSETLSRSEHYLLLDFLEVFYLSINLIDGGLKDFLVTKHLFQERFRVRDVWLNFI